MVPKTGYLISNIFRLHSSVFQFNIILFCIGTFLPETSQSVVTISKDHLISRKTDRRLIEHTININLHTNEHSDKFHTFAIASHDLWLGIFVGFAGIDYSYSQDYLLYYLYLDFRTKPSRALFTFLNSHPNLG